MTQPGKGADARDGIDTHKTGAIIRPFKEHTHGDADDSFWIGVRAGVVALSHLDCWIATLKLRSIIDATMVPLLGQYLGLPPGSLVQSPRAVPHLSRWGYYLDMSTLRYDKAAPGLWPAYRAIIDDYRHLRGHLGYPNGDRSNFEQWWLAAVDIAERQTRADLSGVLTWRTCSIVLPAYNEESVIAETTMECVRALRRLCPNFEIIIVDDGSQDQTGQIAEELAANDASTVVVHNRPNKGYGGALLAGFDAARAEWLFFMDSDGQFDINDIAAMITIAEEHAGAAVLGYRARRSDPFMRKLNAWGWKQATRFLIGLRGIRDIDCAFKLFPTQAIRACSLVAQGASVNAEFLRKFQLMGIPLHQVPVKHLPRTKGSPTGAKASVILRAFRELFRLRHNLKTWQPAAEEAPDPPSNLVEAGAMISTAAHHTG